MIEPRPLFYEFGDFRIDIQRRLLTQHAEPLLITRKSFDALLFFVQNSGRVLEKEELMKTLWPESFVEESNLSQQIFVLRKILGKDQSGNSFIQTIPRRGYKFVAPVRQSCLLADWNGNAPQVRPQDLPDTYNGPMTPPQISSTAEATNHSFAQPAIPSSHCGSNPFRALRAFRPEDSWLFFGRERERDDLLARLRRSPVLAITGASSSGKSSLIQAGLIPALQGGQFRYDGRPIDSWRIAVFRPSSAPFDYLAEVLPGQLAPELSLKQQAEFIADCRTKFPSGGDALRNGISALAGATTAKPGHTHILLVADQLEEVFTLASNQEVRERYIDMLLAASRMESAFPTHLVLALRSDFLPWIERAGSARHLETNIYHLSGMTCGQLRETVEERLRLAATEAEPGLINTLTEDVGAGPGNLALLELVLQQMWERQFLEQPGGPRQVLSNNSYAEIGQLAGALAKHADEVYGDIHSEPQRALVKKIFLKLAYPGENDQPTGRRMRKEALLALSVPEEIEPLLARMASSLLVSIGGDKEKTFVELSHPSSFREWRALRDWLAHNREELRFEQHLMKSAEQWKALPRTRNATPPAVSKPF